MTKTDHAETLDRLENDIHVQHADFREEIGALKQETATNHEAIQSLKSDFDHIVSELDIVTGILQERGDTELAERLNAVRRKIRA